MHNRQGGIRMNVISDRLTKMETDASRILYNDE